MRVSRRTLLRLAAALPAGAALAPLLTIHASAAKGLAAQVRPAPSGTSQDRCAVCGSVQHTMLDSACPSAPRLGRPRVR
jgi:hypothetical protein